MTLTRALIRSLLLCLGLLLLPGTAQHAQAQAFLKPAPVPHNATLLFDGSSTAAWVQHDGGAPCAWNIVQGELEVAPGTGNILTKEKFKDFRLHVEFNIPSLPEAKSQAKGNSGVYLHGLYEIQVLDSFNNETYANGMCGSIYGQKEPDVNACKPAQQWQTYDIAFRAPRFDSSGKIMENPRVTVYHNGIRIHDNVEITIGPTTASLGGPMTPTGPIMLQDHGSRVHYRNIWIQPVVYRTVAKLP